MQRLLVILLLIMCNSYSISQENDKLVPKLIGKILLNGVEGDTLSVNELIQSECISISVDTIYILGTEEAYVHQRLLEYAKILRKNGYRKKEIENSLERQRESLILEYHSLLDPSEFSKDDSIKILSFNVTGIKCAYSTSFKTKSNCFSEEQISYLSIHVGGDKIFIEKVETEPSLYVLGSIIIIRE